MPLGTHTIAAHPLCLLGLPIVPHVVQPSVKPILAQRIEADPRHGKTGRLQGSLHH